MASKLSPQDKQRIQRGITKRVGQKPYENGLYGENSSRDFVMVELYDALGNFIEARDLSLIEANIEVDEAFIKLFPGSHLKAFGFDAGKFRIKYNFLRYLGGNENPVLLRTQAGLLNQTYQINDDASNIYIDDRGKIFRGTKDNYDINPNAAEQLILTNYKYDIDAISPTRTEVRLTAKNIDDSVYIPDFQKLQESMRTDISDTSIEFIKVLNLSDPPPGFSAGSPPPQPELNTSNVLQISPQQNGFVFTKNMIGGTITIPNVFKVGTQTTEVRTEINIIKNSGFEDIEIDPNTGQPTVIEAGWDPSLHVDSVKLVDWTSGFNALDDGIHAGSAAVGYHAKFVPNEGISGGNCLKFIDQNNLYIDYDIWPTIDGHRELSVSQKVLELQSLGASSGDLLNLTFDMKTTKAGKGVEVEIAYPGEIFEEPEPTGRPDGYWDPLNPNPATEEIPSAPPAGYLENTPGNANSIEQQPPSRRSQILTTYNLEFFEPEEGLTTADERFGGEGAWRISDPGIPGAGDPVVTWSPNLGTPQYSKAGTVSDGGEWRWDGYAWNAINATDSPTAPLGTVSYFDDYGENVVNRHPYQLPGQGTPIFARNNFPGENRGWQTGTFIDPDDDAFTEILGIPESIVREKGVILLKDDLVWFVGRINYTTNYNKLYMFTLDAMFPQIRTTLIDDGQGGEHTIYRDIFENGRIQSITRTRNTGNDNNRRNAFIIFYTTGREEDDCNRMFHAEMGADDFIEGPFKLIDFDASFNEQINNQGGEFEWWSRGERASGGTWRHYCVVKGIDAIFEMRDGDGIFFEIEGSGLWLEENTGQIGSFSNAYAELEQYGNYWDVGFGAFVISGHWANYSALVNVNEEGGGFYIKMKNTETDGIQEQQPTERWAFGAGERMNGGAAITFGVRNPGADNYGYAPADNPEGRVGDSSGFKGLAAPIYDDGTEVITYDTNPKKEGALSEFEQWEWDGEQWNTLAGPPVFLYTSLTSKVFSAQASAWGNYEVEFEIPEAWNPVAEWFIKINGHNTWNESLTADTAYGIVWVDNMFADFTLVEQQTETDIFKSFTAQIRTVSDDGERIEINRTFEQAANALSSDDVAFSTYLDGNNSGIYPEFDVSYLVYNPYDLRTYLKIDNQLFLTTNFKKDVVNANFPYGLVYKLYEPLPPEIERLNEVVVVKEMAEPITEDIEIVEFVDTDPGDVVLKSPDVMNVESPIQRRTIDYKTQGDILSEDAFISTELQNEFLSQSLDSVEINVDYGAYENFVNFSSARERISNFKFKLQNIEEFTTISSSYVGVSGSEADLALYDAKIREVKNNFDGFEKYMYFESSSYVSSSIGVSHDNSWPKKSGTGTLTNPYVLYSVSESKAQDWFIKNQISSSLYDNENLNKLSNVLPEHIKFDNQNETYLKMVDMIGHHFDNIWVYIKALGDTYDRREKLTEGISKDLFVSVAQSLGWKLNDGKDTISLARYALGKEVTGSSYSNYSTTSERDASREVWSRIINNMPYFLKHKGTVKAIRGLISAYGIPSTILRVKEYGGPDLPDDASPQFEISRKFTKALDWRGEQYVKTDWSIDTSSNRVPDTIELRFRTPTGSNQILVEKQDSDGNSDFFIRLKDNGSDDQYGFVSFMLSGSGGFKEISSSNFPIYDNDFLSVMVRRNLPSDDVAVSQSYQLNVGKYDAGRSKIELYSTSTMDVTQAASSSYNGQWTGSGEIYIGGENDNSNVGVQFSGSIMEYRHWTEVLNTGSFRNHIGNPKAFDGNTISSSFNNLVLRYSFDDNKDLSTDTAGIRDVSANTTNTYSGSHNNFGGNFFSNVVDETKTNIPSIGALRRVTNKVRIEDNPLKPGYILSRDERATKSAYDRAPNDSNKVGVFFAPTDVINNDIINSVANLNFDNFLGDPRDLQKTNYRGLDRIADNYWQKYTSPNNFWDYIRLLKYYDQSLFPQVRKMIPARAKANLGILVEPNIFERPKVVIGKKPTVRKPYFSASIDLAQDVIFVTGSYNIESFTINDYDQQTGTIQVFGYETGSSILSASGEYLTKEASGSGINFSDLSIWQTLEQPGDYVSSSIEFGDTHYDEVIQPSISGSVLRFYNQKSMKFYSTEFSASINNFFSESFFFADVDNLANENQAIFNSYYAGVKNTKKTTQDGGEPVEVIITSPTKLVTKEPGDSSLDTGEGIVSKFKPKRKKKRSSFFDQDQKRRERKPRTLGEAIKQAQEEKGDFLTQQEEEAVTKDFEKSQNVVVPGDRKKRTKYKKRKSGKGKIKKRIKRGTKFGRKRKKRGRGRQSN